MTKLVCAQGHSFRVLAGHTACPTCGALLDPVPDVGALLLAGSLGDAGALAFDFFSKASRVPMVAASDFA